jgi:hypothetical protein
MTHLTANIMRMELWDKLSMLPLLSLKGPPEMAAPLFIQKEGAA